MATDYYGQAQSENSGGGSTSSSSSSTTPGVYYGMTPGTKNPNWNGGHGNGPYYQGGGRNFQTYDQHSAFFMNNWQNNAKFRTQMVRFAVAYGYNTDVRSVANLWDSAGQKSAALARAGKYMTPQQILKFFAGAKGGMGSGGGGGGGYSTSTSSSVSYDISDAHTAKALTNAVLNAALGREATKDELESYKKALNAAERKDPSRSSSTTTSGPGGSRSSSTSESGIDGSGRQQVLMDKAKATTEGQAFSTQDVFNKAMEVLAGRIG